MAGYLIVGLLAAFGVLSGLWTAFGWLLPDNRVGAVVCLYRPGDNREPLLRRYRWLRDMGFLRMPLILVCETLPEEGELCQCPGVEFCRMEALPARLELERETLD